MTIKLVSFLIACLAPTVLASNSSSTSSQSGAYGVNFFAESANSYYDGYQQAWRYLGWYVACGSPSSRYYKEESHSHDSDDGRYQGNMWCQRYLMWAAVSTCANLDIDSVTLFHRCIRFSVFLSAADHSYDAL